MSLENTVASYTIDSQSVDGAEVRITQKMNQNSKLRDATRKATLA